ncbi:hypothetical protein CLOM_g13572 [Closterium sp. NIES-68]|nr:hypothetical protein CLOM_g13572 [Closterium sp. NIES-68]
MRAVQAELSEPYSVFTYRYFLHHWPALTFLARAPRSANQGTAEATEGDDAEGRAWARWCARWRRSARWRGVHRDARGGQGVARARRGDEPRDALHRGDEGRGVRRGGARSRGHQ